MQNWMLPQVHDSQFGQPKLGLVGNGMTPILLEIHPDILDLLEPDDLRALTDALEAAVKPPPPVDAAGFDNGG
jgi:hypothetical protein